MDQWSSDVVLHVIQFLPCRAATCFAATSRRTAYLVHRFQQVRGPELVAARSYMDVPIGKKRHTTSDQTQHSSLEQILQNALSKIHAPPELAISFNRPGYNNLWYKWQKKLPARVIFFGVVTDQAVQTSFDGHVESDSNAAVLLASMPQATMTPFCFLSQSGNAVSERNFCQHFGLDENDAAAAAPSLSPKVVLLYACGSATRSVDTLLELMERHFPGVVILGGLCTQGICVNQGVPTNFVDGMFGVALSGNVPVQSVVSRGMSSLLLPSPSYPTPTGNVAVIAAENSDQEEQRPLFTVTRVDYVQPGDRGYIFRNLGYEASALPAYYALYEVRDHQHNTVHYPGDIWNDDASFVGIRLPEADGFEIFTLQRIDGLQFWVLLCDSNEEREDIVGAEVDLYNIDGESCLRDVTRCMKLLKEHTQGQTILGAVMTSCAARGPTASGLMKATMADAHAFGRFFPHVPCVGFYANGEIGPKARAARRTAFVHDKAVLQGFTAIFAVFIAPQFTGVKGLELNDSDEQVQVFVRGRFRRLSVTD